MLPIVTEAFYVHDHPNVHLVIEGSLVGDGCSVELLGHIERYPVDGDHALPAHYGRHAGIADGGG